MTYTTRWSLAIRTLKAMMFLYHVTVLSNKLLPYFAWATVYFSSVLYMFIQIKWMEFSELISEFQTY